MNSGAVLTLLHTGTVSLTPVPVSPVRLMVIGLPADGLMVPRSTAPAQVPGCVAKTHWKSMQAWPGAQLPQLPPHPSSPHCLLWQLGLQFLASQAGQSTLAPPPVCAHRRVASSNVSTVQAAP